MSVLTFPSARSADARQVPAKAVWIRPDPHDLALYRVHWRIGPHVGCHPRDRGTPMAVAVWCAARVANHTGCEPADPVVKRLVALGFGQ